MAERKPLYFLRIDNFFLFPSLLVLVKYTANSSMCKQTVHKPISVEPCGKKGSQNCVCFHFTYSFFGGAEGEWGCEKLSYLQRGHLNLLISPWLGSLSMQVPSAAVDFKGNRMTTLVDSLLLSSPLKICGDLVSKFQFVLKGLEKETAVARPLWKE